MSFILDITSGSDILFTNAFYLEAVASLICCSVQTFPLQSFIGSQCDQMDRLLFQYLAIYIVSAQFFAKVGRFKIWLNLITL